MYYQEPNFEYEEKRARIIEELEMFVLDAILAALEGLSRSYHASEEAEKKELLKDEPF
jgi:hypothetical protein